MIRSCVGVIAALVVLAASPACGPGVDLSQALEATDVITGYYDDGLKDGWNYLKPTISFRLRNKSDRKIGPVQITVAYWKDGDDGEWDSLVIQGIRAEGLPANATTESLLARADIGYRLEGARPNFFQHSMFRDVTAKIFASQGGAIVRIGEFKLERVIIPHMQ